MAPRTPLPLHALWASDTEAYIESLLSSTSNTLFRNLCGGVHILDFLTRKPDLYNTVLPEEWRTWFDCDAVAVGDVLELLLRADLKDVGLDRRKNCGGVGHSSDGKAEKQKNEHRWRDLPAPPASLLEYIDMVRKHCLRRDFDDSGIEERTGSRDDPAYYEKVEPGSEKQKKNPLARNMAVGMKPKKQHEVAEFAAYVDCLARDLCCIPPYSSDAPNGEESDNPVSLVDFGSGQNYLGRTLASQPYERHVVAIERRHHNVDGARDKDVLAKLAKKEVIMRNKKEFKRLVAEGEVSPKWWLNTNGIGTGGDHTDGAGREKEKLLPGPKHEVPIKVQRRQTVRAEVGKGAITYVEAEIEDGRLEHILYEREVEDVEEANATTESAGDPSPTLQPQPQQKRPPLFVISLHSCGNLLHHGLRSLTLNPSVRAVAMIGCCYNLMTERLGPATYKHPQLRRSNHPRLEATGSARDPHGFPMSRTLEEYQCSPFSGEGTGRGRGEAEKGVRLNITARMMAVQAPYNWGEADSEMFFRRHFYRALLQKILLDKGVVKECRQDMEDDDDHNIVGGALLSNDGNSLSGKDSSGKPLIVGSLKKTCFASFTAYVYGALEKLQQADPVEGAMIKTKTADLTTEDIMRYERDFGYAKKNLSVMWSLMAFSAGVIESVIVVDRWLFLREQDCVERCWVEAVFDYRLSPRNLVVVGVKKKEMWA